MRIIGMMVCGIGEAQRYLRQSLNELKRFCNDTIICCNGEDKERDGIIKEYGFWQYRDDREWGIYQPKIKTDLLKKVGRLRPNWVLPLDADEIFTNDLTRTELEKLTNMAVGCYFYLVNMWNNPQHYAAGLSFWNIRFFKYEPMFSLEYENKPLHCGLAPPFAYNMGKYVPFIVKHYGLMLKQDREAKIQRYKQYDPGAKWKSPQYYEALGKDGSGTEYNEEELIKKVRDDVLKIGKQKEVDENNLYNTMNSKKYLFLKRLSDGIIIDVEQGQAFDLLATKKFSLVNDTKVERGAVVKEPHIEQNENECPICGFVAKSSGGLRLHKVRHK